MSQAELDEDPRLPAAVALIGRTGAEEFQIRYCEEEEPVVWLAAARWHDHWEAAGGTNPRQAIFRLCDQLIDGGRCTHCSRPTGFAAEFDDMPLGNTICWYQWDPELETFRRGCE